MQVIGVKPIAQLLEIDMKRLLFCAAAVCLMVLPGCASTGESRYTNDAKFVVDQDYVNAVKYVSHKLMGCTNLDAYVKTFPVKYQGFLNQGVLSKDIASYITAYNKSKLVNLQEL